MFHPYLPGLAPYRLSPHAASRLRDRRKATRRALLHARGLHECTFCGVLPLARFTSSPSGRYDVQSKCRECRRWTSSKRRVRLQAVRGRRQKVWSLEKRMAVAVGRVVTARRRVLRRVELRLWRSWSSYLLLVGHAIKKRLKRHRVDDGLGTPDNQALNNRCVSHRNRARAKGLPGNWYTRHARAAIQRCKGECPVCRLPMGLLDTVVLDHWVPLASESCPGSVPENMVPLCSSCNRDKADKDPHEWLCSRYPPAEVEKIMRRIDRLFVCASQSCITG